MSTLLPPVAFPFVPLALLFALAFAMSPVAQNTKGAPFGAPFFLFFLYLSSEYQFCPSERDIFPNFLFAILTGTYKDFVVFSLLTNTFPFRDFGPQHSPP